MNQVLVKYEKVTNGDTVNVYATTKTRHQVNVICREELCQMKFEYNGGDVRVESFYAHAEIKEVEGGYQVFTAKPVSWEEAEDDA